jgi:hypothetical protein
MSSEEYELFLKWDEVQTNKHALAFKSLEEDKAFRAKFDNDPKFKDAFSWFLHGFPTDKDFKITKTLKHYKNITDALFFMWNPPFLDEEQLDGDDGWSIEGEGIQPEVIPCRDNKSLTQYWQLVRTFISKAPNRGNIGRMLRFLVRDKITMRLYGVIAIGSDYGELSVREHYIGWTRENKYGDAHKLNHTAKGQTIVPTQPLGYNYNGGKLMALLTLSDVVENEWNKAYNDPSKTDYKGPSKLVGLTTTSLYGAKSGKGTQYDGLRITDSIRYWRNLGESEGSPPFEPSNATFRLVAEYVRENYPETFWYYRRAKRESGLPKSKDIRNRLLTFVYRELGLDASFFRSNFRRGVFFSELFTNTKEFLRGEIDEGKLIRAFPNDVESLTRYWKDKHAYKRIAGRMRDKKVTYDVNTFYNDLAIMTWEQARKQYLSEEVLAQTKPPTDIQTLLKENPMPRKKGSKNKPKTATAVDNKLQKQIQVCLDKIVELVKEATRQETIEAIQASIATPVVIRKRRKVKRAKRTKKTTSKPKTATQPTA